MRTSPAHILHASAACLATLLIAAPAAHGADAEDRTPLDLTEEPARQAVESGGGGGYARMIVGLAVVIAVIYGLSWVLKQVKASKEGSATGAGLAPISSLPLGPNRSVHLVRVGRELVLLGAAEKGVVPIRTYHEDEARAAGLLPDEDAPALPAGALRPASATTATTVIENLRKLTVRR
jgi:flagellar protein FliO/FliZ